MATSAASVYECFVFRAWCKGMQHRNKGDEFAAKCFAYNTVRGEQNKKSAIIFQEEFMAR